MDYINRISELVEHKRDLFIEANDQIWAFAEPRFQEVKSAKLLAELLESQGFKTTWGIGGADTAFMSQWGEGKPVIGFLGEYDALSGLSQQADVAVHTPIEEGGQGHGCGHHTLGAGSAGAAVALKDYMTEAGLKGTVRFYGCPAEENAGGKAFMVRDGAFDGCDIAITWHTGTSTGLQPTGLLANFRVFYTFKGTSAHAAGAPHLGRSALDAVEIMNVGVNYMREHMISDARVHYAVTDTGGTAPNVVQSRAQVLYAIRAPKVTDVQELKRRIDNIARGAALITETEVEIKQVSAYTNYLANSVVGAEMQKYMEALHHTLTYTDEELVYLQKFKDATPEADIQNYKALAQQYLGLKGAELEAHMQKPISDVLFTRYPKGSGSTDVGDVSWVVPTAWCFVSCYSMGCTGHSWLETAQGKSSVTHKGMLYASKVMALTGLSFILDPTLVDKARIALLEELDGQVYKSPLPEGYKPEIW
jgi:aminobenzoyl-glutamate utilization protein B